MFAPSRSPSPAGSDSSYVSTKLAFVAPIVPGFVRRVVPRFGFGRPVEAPTRVEIPTATSHVRSWSSDMIRTGTTTPPPSYSETLAPILTPLKYARRMASEKAAVAAAVELIAGRNLPVAPPQPTGILWKVANQGISLLQQAASEAADSDSPALGRGTSFSRRLFINGLTYLLQALPAELTHEETMSLSAALPACLVPAMPESPLDADRIRHDSSYFPANASYDPYPEDPELMYPAYDQYPAHQQAVSPHSNLLYRVSSFVIVKTFVLITILIPWLQFLCATAFRLNKELKVSQRLFNTTLSTADLAARATVTLSSTLLTLQNGPVGRFVEGAITWWLRGVSGGVYDGMGEGLAVLGLRQQQQQQQQQEQHPMAAMPHAHGYAPYPAYYQHLHQQRPHSYLQQQPGSKSAARSFDRPVHAAHATGRGRPAHQPHRRAAPGPLGRSGPR